MFIQSTVVSFKQGAVLIMGPAGVGKSTLALHLIQCGARLISDDGVELRVHRGRLLAVSPDSMRGCLAVRGLGILSGFSVRRRARVRCVIQLTQKSVSNDAPHDWHEMGVSVPMFYLKASDALLGARAMAAFWVSIGKIGLFSELNVLKRKQIQFTKG